MSDPSDGELEQAVGDWARDARHDEARQSRSERQWQEQLAAEGMRFSGLLLDLAERSATARISTTGGREHSGTVAEAGADYVRVAPDERPEVLIATAAITSVNVASSPRTTIPSEREVPEGARRLDDVLASLTSKRTRVRFWLEGSSEVRSGELVTVGIDIAVFTTADQTGAVFVPVNKITEVITG